MWLVSVGAAACLPPQFWRRTLCRSLDNAARKKRTLVQHAKRRRERNVPVATNVRFGSKADSCTAAPDVRFGPIADIYWPSAFSEKRSNLLISPSKPNVV